MILEAEADLVPHGSKVSALRPIFRMAPIVVGQVPMVQGLASGSVGSWHEVPRTSLGLRSASVGAEQTSPGRLATHLPQGFGCCVAGASGSKVSPLHSIFHVKMG